MFILTKVRVSQLALLSAAAFTGEAYSVELIDMSFSPAAQTVNTGDSVELTIVIQSAGVEQEFIGLDAILDWNPGVLALQGVVNCQEEYPFSPCGFMNDPDDINEDFTDGNAILTALASPFFPAAAPQAPESLIIATLQFEALTSSPGTQIRFVPQMGIWSETQVLLPGGANITGDISMVANVTVSGGPGPECPADFDGDGEVGVTDFLDLLAAWGLCAAN